MRTFADAYIICDDNQHCIIYVGEVTFITMTMANGTYEIVDLQSHDMTGFQNDSRAVLLLHLAYLDMLAAQSSTKLFEVTSHKIQNDLTIQQLTTDFPNKDKCSMSM